MTEEKMPRVAAVQMESRLLDLDHNLGKVVSNITQAGQAGVDLAVFPETILTGYNMSLAEAARVAEPIPGKVTEELANACKREEIFALVGLIEAGADSNYYNTAVLVGPAGVFGIYRKTHLPLLGVDRYLSPGDSLPTLWETPIGRLGALVCYDLRFPEPIRCLALAGAQIVALPTAWPQAARLYPDHMARSRASENRVYLVAANNVGEERGTRYLGRSVIISPSGEVLAEADGVSERILVADVDPAESDRKHLVFQAGEYELDLFGDRRPELYAAITAEKVQEDPG